MKKLYRRLILSVPAVLLLIMLFSCSYAPGDVTGDRIIAVSIGGGSTSRLIKVEEYDVTSVDVEIFGPGGPLEPIFWMPAYGAQTYYIQAQDLGEHEIIVTHTSDENGTPVTAVESAFFRIEPILITVINIMPGAIGVINILEGEEEPICDLVGTWVGTVPFPIPVYDDDWNYIETILIVFYVEIMYFEDGIATHFTYITEGGPIVDHITFRGTYVCDLPNVSGEWTHWYNFGRPEPHWDLIMNEEVDPHEPEPIIFSSEVTMNADRNSIEVVVDFGDGLTAPWTLTRQ